MRTHFSLTAAICVCLALLGGQVRAARVIVDELDDGFTAEGPWSASNYSEALGGSYLWASVTTEEPTATARWEADPPLPGSYKVYVCYRAGSNRSSQAQYTVFHEGGVTPYVVDQSVDGEQWVYLGEHVFGASAAVELTNSAPTPGKVVVADGVQLLADDLDEVREVVPGVTYTHRTLDDPLELHVLTIDLAHPRIRLETVLANDRCAYDYPSGGEYWVYASTERPSSMAARKSALAAVNGDYWSGSPEGYCVLDGQTVIYPRYRSAFGLRTGEVPIIRNWNKDYPSPGDSNWLWPAYVREQGAAQHEITLKNRWDVNDGWLVLFTPVWGAKTCGDARPGVTEVVVSGGAVQQVRVGQPGVSIPADGYVLSGRGTAATWLSTYCQVSEQLTLVGDTPDPNVLWAVGAGPRTIVNGSFYQDPYAGFPTGEDFSEDWKHTHYDYLQPRTAIGYSADGRTLVIAVADGRQSQFSAGITMSDMADVLMEFGAYQGMDLDSGGSAAMFLGGEVVSSPSDYASKWGRDGVERRVCNGIVIYADTETSTTEPGWLHGGWNLVSVPLEVADPSVPAVFADCAAAGNTLENSVYRYSLSTGYEIYPGDFTRSDVGRGYWLHLETPAENSIEGFPAEGDAAIPLESGWNLFGAPFPSGVGWADCVILRGHLLRTLPQAEGLGWIQEKAYYYDGTYKFLSSQPGADDTELRPWRGYWMLALVDDLTLVVPTPSS